MEKYDISTISRDELKNLLGRAKDAFVEYTRCFEAAEKVRRSLEGQKMEVNNDFSRQWLIFFGVVMVTLILVGLITKTPELMYLGILLGCCGAYWSFTIKKDSKNAQKNVIKYEAQLPDLEKKETEAFDKFYSVVEPYEFPRDYWYEHAIATMLKFVENKRADSWKEVVREYENHLHQMRMEENARKTLEEAKNQTAIAIQNRNASRWTAAGVWLRR